MNLSTRVQEECVALKAVHEHVTYTIVSSGQLVVSVSMNVSMNVSIVSTNLSIVSTNVSIVSNKCDM